MDLFPNILLGGTPVVGKAAPAGKIASVDFASLLFQGFGAPTGKKSGHSKLGEEQPGGKPAELKSLADPAQQFLASLAIAVVQPAQPKGTPPVVKPNGKAAGLDEVAAERARSLTGQALPEQLNLPAAGLVMTSAVEQGKAANIAGEKEGSSDKVTSQKADGYPQAEKIVDPDLKELEQSEPIHIPVNIRQTNEHELARQFTGASKAENPVAGKVAAKSDGPAKPTELARKKIATDIPRSGAIEKSTEAKSSEVSAGKDSDISRSIAAKSPSDRGTESGQTAATLQAKPLHELGTLAKSAVDITLKQTLPAQTRVANVAKATLPALQVVTANREAGASRTKADQSHAQAETQSQREEAKKVAGTDTNFSQGVVEAKPSGQVTPVAHVNSSELANASPKRSSEAGPSSVPTKQQLPVHDTAATSSTSVALQSAKLLDALGRSELRVGMKMGDLGNVEIRTQLHHDQIRAEISVERGDLSRTLASELPALQQKLRDHDVPVASIVVNHQAAAGSGSFERGSQQQQQAFTPMAHTFGIEPFLLTSSPEESRNSDSSLDVHI